MNEKTIQCLPNPSQHVPIYLQQFPSYSSRKCKKIAVFTYCSPHFCFPWRRPCSMYLYIFNSFRVIRCLTQCVSQKIAIFYHIFVSPGVAPEAIEKTRMASLPNGEKISKICLFFLTWSTTTNVTDGRTLHDSEDPAYASHRAVKTEKLCCLSLNSDS